MADLHAEISEVRQALLAGQFASEAAISQGAVLRLLNGLGWPTWTTTVVVPEFSLQGRRVDFALCHPAGKPAVFVEVKQFGITDGAERQLFEYAFHVGVPLAILTNGREWSFFVPGEQGDYGERRVYKLDLVERELDECVNRLKRYLSYPDVCSGLAIENARLDYRAVSRGREIRLKLPEAWRQLLVEDEFVAELLAERVEALCGYKPVLDTVVEFLRAHATSGAPPGAGPARAAPAPAQPQRLMTTALADVASSRNEIGFELRGRWTAVRNGRELLIRVFEMLDRTDPTFCERFGAMATHGRSRRYLAQRREDLYPGRPDLAADHSHQLKPGWWLGTNHSHAAVRKIISMARGVAGLKFGTDLRVELGE